MKKISIIFIFIFVFLGGMSEHVSANTQKDSLSVVIIQDTVVLDTISPVITSFAPDPTKATWYAIVCPGLGQIYNRSYWKVPVLYGGIATLSYLIIWNGRMYNDYRNAYQDIMDNDPNTNSYESIFSNISGGDLTWRQSTLKRKRDYYRRYRDLSIFGMALLYVVSVIDSYVDAHLYDFSVTDDLSLRVEPVIKNSFYLQDPVSSTFFGLQCRINF